MGVASEIMDVKMLTTHSVINTWSIIAACVWGGVEQEMPAVRQG